MLPFFSFSQEMKEKSESVKIYFRLGSLAVDESYMNNNETLTRLASLLEEYMQENKVKRGGISIAAYASPEGSVSINTNLVNARAQAVVDMLSKRIGGEVGYEINFTGIDWDLLISEVENNDQVPSQKEVLDILKNTPDIITVNGKRINERNRQLQRLHNGVPYRWLFENVYPYLRYAAVRLDSFYALELRIEIEGPVIVDAEGGNVAVSYVTNAPESTTMPKVTTTADWISDINTDEYGTITFVAAPNLIAEPRSATMKMNYLGHEQEFVVEQAAAEPKMKVKSEGLKIYFRLGSSVVDEKYMNNDETLIRLTSLLEEYMQKNQIKRGGISIAAYASPEGPVSINTNLVNARAQAVVDILSKRVGGEVGYEIDFTGIDWDLLISEVENNDQVPSQKEVLDILKNTPDIITVNGKRINERNRQLQRLHNGVPYRWLFENVYPYLRYATVQLDPFYALELRVEIESPVIVGAEGGNVAVPYVTNAPENTTMPKVTTTADWISNIITDEFGTIAFVAAPNLIAEPRSATMKMTYLGHELEFVVEQAAAEPKLSITSQTPVNMGAEGGNATVSYEINTTDSRVVTVSSPVDWITSIKTTENEITFEVCPNKKSKPRTTTLIVVSGELSTEVVVNQEARDCNMPVHMSLQSNLLYDAILIPNIGAEIYLGANFSVDANWHYAWWRIDKKHYYWRTYGGDIALRWWFGRNSRVKPLTGHHIGAFGQMITYDFEFGKNGVLADRWSWTAGLEYGYSLPIAERLNLDFTLGLGYHWGEFYEYKPIDNHYVWQATKHRQYMAPTKFEVSLVWLIGCDNYNKWEGRKR